MPGKEIANLPCLVAGVVASAGGLSAYKCLFSNLPESSGIAFVVVPHLDPKHKSLMVELLTNQTHIPIVEVTDRSQIEPDHIYVIPPGKQLSIDSGFLQLTDVEFPRAEVTIDYFQSSLAQERKIDITDRKRHENELLASMVALTQQAHMLELLVGGSGSGVLVVDAHHRFSHFNDSAKLILGQGPVEQPPSSWPRIYGFYLPDKETLYRWQDLPLIQALRGQASVEKEIFVRNKNINKEVWCTMVAVPLKNDHGEVRGAIAVVRDISEQKRYISELFEREERTRAIMNSTAEGIVIFNRHAIIQEVNNAALAIFQYSAEELVGTEIGLLVEDAYWSEKELELKEHLLQGDCSLFQHGREIQGKRKSGEVFPLEVTLTRIDHLDLFCGTVRDLSATKKLEREVANASICEQERIGREIHDGIGQQLTGINMMASSLKRDLVKQGMPENELLNKMLEQINVLIGDVRQISHGLAPLTEIPEGLQDALLRLAEQVSEASGVRCSLSYPKGLKMRDAIIAAQVYRIVQESVNNAVKHAQSKNIVIELREVNDFPEVTIRDDGKGFDQASPSSDEGAGMRIMKYRASMIGGNLIVKSQPGKGTTIKLKK